MKENLNEYFTHIITQAKRQKLRSGIASAVSTAESIRKGIHRIPSKSEANAVAVQPLHHYVFCSHNVPYWRTCAKCGRDKELAERNAEMILGKAHTLVSK